MIPEEIRQTIGHKELYQALEDNDEEQLRASLSAFARISVLHAYEDFDLEQGDTEWKNVIKNHVYLDALIRLYRLPKTIHQSIAALQERVFWNLEAGTIQMLLDKFTEV